MAKRIGLIIVVTLQISGSISCQDFTLRNKVRVSVSGAVTRLPAGIRYSYKVSSGPESLQNVWQFWVLTSIPKDSIRDVSAPKSWEAGVPDNEVHASIRWGSPADGDLPPGNSQEGFTFLSSLPIAIAHYYIEGYTPPPSWDGPVEDDSIPGYHNLTPYGPGVVGTTIGPTLPADPFESISFIDTLISHKHQAFNLGWIRNKGVVTSLDQKLENVKDQIQRGNTNAARNILHAFLNEVEALNKEGDQLTSEAYALLRFNTEYLLEKLR